MAGEEYFKISFREIFNINPLKDCQIIEFLVDMDDKLQCMINSFDIKEELGDNFMSPPNWRTFVWRQYKYSMFEMEGGVLPGINSIDFFDYLQACIKYCENVSLSSLPGVEFQFLRNWRIADLRCVVQYVERNVRFDAFLPDIYA